MGIRLVIMLALALALPVATLMIASHAMRGVFGKNSVTR